METSTHDPAPAPSPGASPEGQPDLVGLAHQLAQKHAATPKPAPKINKGGRRSTAEEAQAWLAKNGLRAIPQDAPGEVAGDCGGGYQVDPAFVRQMAEAALKAVEAYRQRAVYLKALAIGADKALARELGDGNGAPPGAIQVISVSLAEISQKYGWLSQWTPEVAVIVAMGAWFAKDMAVIRRLDQIRKENEELTQHAPATN